MMPRLDLNNMNESTGHVTIFLYLTKEKTEHFIMIHASVQHPKLYNLMLNV